MYAFTREGVNQYESLTTSSQALTIIDFARQSITHLESRDTIRAYRNAWKQAIADGLVSEEDQWRLAELTWQMTENGVEGQQWARDIDTSTTHVTFLRKVWSIYQVNQPEARTSQPYVAYLVKIWDTYRDNQVITRPKFADASVDGLVISGFRSHTLSCW